MPTQSEERFINIIIQEAYQTMLVCTKTIMTINAVIDSNGDKPISKELQGLINSKNEAEARIKDCEGLISVINLRLNKKETIQ